MSERGEKKPDQGKIKNSIQLAVEKGSLGLNTSSIPSKKLFQPTNVQRRAVG
jgi:hypothetical protein